MFFKQFIIIVLIIVGFSACGDKSSDNIMVDIKQEKASIILVSGQVGKGKALAGTVSIYNIDNNPLAKDVQIKNGKYQFKLNKDYKGNIKVVALLTKYHDENLDKTVDTNLTLKSYSYISKDNYTVNVTPLTDIVTDFIGNYTEKTDIKTMNKYIGDIIGTHKDITKQKIIYLNNGDSTSSTNASTKLAVTLSAISVESGLDNTQDNTKDNTKAVRKAIEKYKQALVLKIIDNRNIKLNQMINEVDDMVYLDNLSIYDIINDQEVAVPTSIRDIVNDIKNQSQKNTLQDIEYEYTIINQDDVNNSFIYTTKESLPSWLTLLPRGILIGTPSNKDVGRTKNIQFMVNKGDGSPIVFRKPFNIEIKNVNDTPTLRGSPTTSIYAREDYNYTVYGSDVDYGDNLVYSLSNQPSWLKIHYNTGKMSGRPTKHDVKTTNDIKVIVTDIEGLRNTITFDLTVKAPINQAPKIKTNSIINVKENTLFVVKVEATDIDDDNLTYYITNNNENFEINQKSGVLLFKYAPDYENESQRLYSVGIRVYDGKLNANITLTINISDVQSFIKAAVYDNNRTKTVTDDRLYIYFDENINKDDVNINIYKIEGGGSIGDDSNHTYSGKRKPYFKDTIYLNNNGTLSIAFDMNSSKISLANFNNGKSAIRARYKEPIKVIPFNIFAKLKTDANRSLIPNDDGSLQRGIDRNFTKDIENNTITDNTLNLMWENRNNVSKKTWGEANNYCNNLILAEYNDWYVPYVDQVESIQSYNQPNLINSLFLTKPYTWSSSTSLEVPKFVNSHWVTYGYGLSKLKLNTGQAYIRCVRDTDLELKSGFTISAMTKSRFIKDNRRNVVFDTTTNLMWEDTGDKNSTLNKKSLSDAINACEALGLAGYQDWHLPNIKELKSLLNKSNIYAADIYRHNTPTNESIFQYRLDDVYISSTISSKNDKHRYYLINFSHDLNDNDIGVPRRDPQFNYGYIYNYEVNPNNQNQKFSYRCVRSAY